MTKKHFVLLIVVLVGVLLLTGCTAAGANSWPGVTVDSENNTVYVAYGPRIYAVDATTGVLRWQYPADRVNQQKTWYAAPILTEDGQLIVGGYDKVLYSFNPASGTENWTFAGAQNRYIGSILVFEDTIYAPVADGSVYAISLQGSPVWQQPFQAEQALWAAPVPSADGETLYIAGMDRNLYAINRTDGSLLWQKEMDGASVGSPALGEDGRLYIGNFAGQMLALNQTDGGELWKSPTGGWVYSGPVLADGNLYFGDFDGYFYALNSTDGAESWKIKPDEAIVGTPLLVDDNLYFGSEAGKLFAVDLRGNIVWERETGGNIYTTPVSSGDLVIAAPINSTSLLVAFDKNGNQKWTFAPEQ